MPLKVGTQYLSQNPTFVLFIELRKAFDGVPHTPLLQKLASLNLDFHLDSWISHYLCKLNGSVLELFV